MIEAEFRIRTWQLFAGAILIPLLAVLEAFLFYPAQLRSGDLPTDADSIGIPLHWAVISAPFNILILTLFTLPAVLRYQGDASWMTFDRAHPWRAGLSILLYAAPAAFVIGDLMHSLITQPAYHATILIVGVPAVFWLLMLRGAMAAPRRGPARVDAG